METVVVPARKRIALVAHDRKKPDLLAWAAANAAALAPHDLYATGTTGRLIHEQTGLVVTRFLSGPLGGDLQLGAAIAEGRIDMVFFFWDPLTAQPHEPDVRALLRIAVVWDVPVAQDRTEAAFLISSPLMTHEFTKRVPAAADRGASGG